MKLNFLAKLFAKTFLSLFLNVVDVAEARVKAKINEESGNEVDKVLKLEAITVFAEAIRQLIQEQLAK